VWRLLALSLGYVCFLVVYCVLCRVTPSVLFPVVEVWSEEEEETVVAGAARISMSVDTAGFSFWVESPSCVLPPCLISSSEPWALEPCMTVTLFNKVQFICGFY
jgi:hypothetical protein